MPKREKARILAAMQQSSNSRYAEKAVAAELEDESALFSTVVRAHLDTCDFTREKVEPMLARAREQPSYTACPPTLVSTWNLEQERNVSSVPAACRRNGIKWNGGVRGRGSGGLCQVQTSRPPGRRQVCGQVAGHLLGRVGLEPARAS